MKVVFELLPNERNQQWYLTKVVPVCVGIIVGALYCQFVGVPQL